MKPTLLILSDLFGKENDSWIQYYIKNLKATFSIVYYDSRILGSLKDIHTNKSELHRQFIEYGIKNAINSLFKNHTTQVSILAFSIGGTIAWKAALNGLNVNKMHLISSTRLRYEKEKPLSDIYLSYGENDLYRPKNEWLENFNLNYELVEKSNHDLYKSESFSCMMCNKLTQQNTL